MNKDHIGQLWDEITPKLYGYLVNMVRNKDLAQDLLQNSWMKAVENLESFHGGDKEFSSWLFAIARNEARAHWRKSGREVPFDPDIHDKAAEQSSDGDIFVDQVIARLNMSDQELVRLRYIGGLSTAEVAKILKINPVTARVRLHRAVSFLRNNLKQHESF